MCIYDLSVHKFFLILYWKKILKNKSLKHVWFILQALLLVIPIKTSIADMWVDALITVINGQFLPLVFGIAHVATLSFCSKLVFLFLAF